MSDKIKIVYIINSFALGGAEKLLLNLCRSLNKEKFEIFVCSATAGGPLANEFEKAGLAIKIFQKRTKLGLSVIWQIYKFLKEVKPQIVHTHLFGGDTWGRLAAILAGIPVIISTEHSINLEEGWLKKKIKLVLSWFSKKIIAISEGVRDYSIKAEKISPKKLAVIYNGIDLKTFQYRGFRPIQAGQLINAAVTARLEKEKGHKYLLAALSKINKKYPNFTLNIIGTGSLEADLKQQAANLGVLEKIVFWGQQLEPEKILKNMDLFILPSLLEGLGIVLLEAQAIGVPVLASNVGGIKEVIKDNETGLLFEPQNAQAIFEAVNALLSNQALAKKLIENAYAQVQAKFTLAKMVEAYEKLYLELVK